MAAALHRAELRAVAESTQKQRDEWSSAKAAADGAEGTTRDCEAEIKRLPTTERGEADRLLKMGTVAAVEEAGRAAEAAVAECKREATSLGDKLAAKRVEVQQKADEAAAAMQSVVHRTIARKQCEELRAEFVASARRAADVAKTHPFRDDAAMSAKWGEALMTEIRTACTSARTEWRKAQDALAAALTQKKLESDDAMREKVEAEATYRARNDGMSGLRAVRDAATKAKHVA